MNSISDYGSPCVREAILITIVTYVLVAYGLAAPIATSLVGGGPAVIIWGLSLPFHFAHTYSVNMVYVVGSWCQF